MPEKRTVKQRFMPKAPVLTVRADASIAECVRLMRDKGVGALVVVSEGPHEEMLGIFTERDLVQQVDLIQGGAFWKWPVKRLMTPKVYSISPEQIGMAPKFMAQHGIRHLPVVAHEKGRKRLVAVLSMRDIFRIVLESVDYNLDAVFPPPPERQPHHTVKAIGVISADPAIGDLVESASEVFPHLVLRARPVKNYLRRLTEHIGSFDALLIDIDGMKREDWEQLLERNWGGRKLLTLVVFNPRLHGPEDSADLHRLAQGRRFHLLSKPLALGLLYERFLKML